MIDFNPDDFPVEDDADELADMLARDEAVIEEWASERRKDRSR